MEATNESGNSRRRGAPSGSWRHTVAGVVLLAGLAVVGSCNSAEHTRYIAAEGQGPLAEETIALNASSEPLPFESAVVLTDNDEAFRSKLALIDGARETIDLAYFLFADDQSSSAMAEALLAATERGVDVRMLVDYQTNYKNLDVFSMLEEYGSRGAGSLQVRFYNRPTRSIVQDAVYLTMGCGEEHADRKRNDCATEKYAEIDALFAAEDVDGNYSNLQIGNSGLFLSGLYAKDAEVIAFAVQQGQGIDAAALDSRAAGASAADRENLEAFARLYWTSRAGSAMEAAVARVKLMLAFTLYGDEINPVYDAFTGFLPVDHPRDGKQARLDWGHFNDVLHHKLLLVDQERMQLGGRNVENSYHMVPNELIAKYVFMDTDVVLDLAGGGDEITASFDRLWDFRSMVASLDEVRKHAPNDFLEGHRLAKTACGELDESSEAYRACYETSLAEWMAARDARLERRRTHMAEQAALYAAYQRDPAVAHSPSFEIDPTAEIYYVENLPFYIPEPGDPPSLRSYGSVNGLEGEHGKHIHALWLEAMRNAAATATPEQPQEIIIHNAYFVLPSNLMALMGQLVDGTIDAGDLKITVLTNSIETTDLNVVNLAARHQMKAFADYYAANRDPERGAEFSYHEYLPTRIGPTQSNLSLHSKVMVFGPDVFIGSANADVRSYMQDSNNGLLVRNAPEFVADYTSWIHDLLADERRTEDLTRYLIDSSREDLLAEDLVTQRMLTGKYGLEGRLGDPQKAEQRYIGSLNASHDLTAATLRGGAAALAAQREFDEMFKGL